MILQFSSRTRCSTCGKISKPGELVHETDGAGPLICPPCYWTLQEILANIGTRHEDANAPSRA